MATKLNNSMFVIPNGEESSFSPVSGKNCTGRVGVAVGGLNAPEAVAGVGDNVGNGVGAGESPPLLPAPPPGGEAGGGVGVGVGVDVGVGVEVGVGVGSVTGGGLKPMSRV